MLRMHVHERECVFVCEVGGVITLYMWWMFCFVEPTDVEYKSKVAQEQLETRIAQLTNEKEELLTKCQHYEEKLKTANECENSTIINLYYV